MGNSADVAKLPDLRSGIPASDLRDSGMLAGRVDGEEVVLARSGDAFYAIGAHCTHYHGPLAEGLIAGRTVRCPWHHACFDLKTGEPVRAPALDPVPCWRVELAGNTVFVREKLAEPAPRRLRDATAVPASIVIIGGGAAGVAAADMIRREGYEGQVTMISADSSAPPDRPNLSKDYLAGTAKEDWIPLRSAEYYSERRIALLLGSHVSSLKIREREIELDDGRTYPFDALLIATGAHPVRLNIPGAPAIPIHYLRTFADSQAIIDALSRAKRAVVVGASFIGLEVAASLRARGVAVDVVAPDREPLERVMGSEVGRFVRSVHEANGVTFHLGATVGRVDGRMVTLSDGTSVNADLMVVGAGVKPSTELAERAGLTMDRGIAVNEYLETSAPGVFAAGDVARWPDPFTGERIRVEHWVVAERQGQVAARNMLGQHVRYDAVPFFWSQHYDMAINYVGHSEKWDAVEIDGSLEARDCEIAYNRGGRVLAVATIGRDKRSLEAELQMERETAVKPQTT
jgi:NADPH-dependent 2,4-dienoyl-CoA reductase/sulfur reductase-like enzyme/nitrite reductase/ring-hydroxylating ferredoxin subunit